jgi:hypothetical protein
MLKNSPGLSSYRGFGVPSSGTISRGTFYRGENPTDYSKRMLKERGDPLAEFSGIHPEKIIGKQKPTKEQALRFVSGGSPIGDSIVSGAKNKIVGFDRNIKPKPNNLKSLIGNLASNIFSTSSVNNIFNATEKEKTPEKKEKGFKPFGGFFDRIKEALAFITFFGSKKNLDRIRENVDNLKTTFAETFEVAKSLRKVILKIIEQISGLSGGGGGGGLIGAIMPALGGLVGGLVPGLGGKRPPNIAGPAMKQEGNLISKMPKALTSGGGGIGKLLLGGAAALGTGAAISGLSQPDNSENIQSGYTTPEVSGNVLDKFNSILDRFDKVIESLLKGKGSGSQKPSGSSGDSKPSSSTSTGSSSGAASDGKPIDYSNLKGGDISSTAGKVQTLYDEFRSLGYTDEGSKRVIAEIGREGSFANQNLFGTHSDPATRITNQGMISWNAERRTKLLSEAKKAGVLDTSGNIKQTPEALRFQARFLTNEVKGYSKELDTSLRVEGSSGSKISNLLRDKYIVYDPKYAGGIDSQFGSAETKRYYQMISPGLKPSTLPTKQAPGQAPQTPKPAPGQAPQAPTPKPAPGQQSIQVIPLGQQQSQVQPAPSGGGGKISTPPSPKQNGPTAPFLPSSNPNNFLTLYSRMVYNIVDG